MCRALPNSRIVLRHPEARKGPLDRFFFLGRVLSRKKWKGPCKPIVSISVRGSEVCVCVWIRKSLSFAFVDLMNLGWKNLLFFLQRIQSMDECFNVIKRKENKIKERKVFCFLFFF